MGRNFRSKTNRRVWLRLRVGFRGQRIRLCSLEATENLRKRNEMMMRESKSCTKIGNFASIGMQMIYTLCLFKET